MSLQKTGITIGDLGISNVVFKHRKFRWIAYAVDPMKGIEISPSFVKISSRPSLTIEETEANFLNTSFSGKTTWDNITLTYYDYDCSQDSDLMRYMAEVYQNIEGIHVSKHIPKLDFILEMMQDDEPPLERWILKNAWPTALNFGELDYTSSESVTIEMTLRYTQAVYESKESGFSEFKPWSPPENWVIHSPVADGAAALEEFLSRTALAEYRS